MMARTSKSGASRARSAKSGELFDQLLITLILQGDRQAGDRLFQRWNPRLLRTARRYAGDGALAEQLAQDCWVAIWRGIGSLRDPSRFAPWVFSIMRKKGAGQISGAIRDREMIRNDAELPAAPPDHHDDRLAINQAFAGLPSDQRLAAHLFFVEGLTLPEIAAVQSIPIGTAKSRLFHARRKLKAALTPEITQGEN
ncbi:MAG: RNA polymerase sigma factor [Erythrobacter sp.]